MNILIDADLELLYRPCFHCEPMMYYIDGQTFNYKKDAVLYCKNNEIDPSEITKEKDYFSLKYTLKTVDEYYEKIVDDVSNKYGLTAFDGVHTQCFITTGDNFRYEVDDTYKAHRFDTPKPKWYNEVKAYIIDKYNADESDGLEADDRIGIEAGKLRANKEEYIVVSQDKDLDQIQGLHYNTRRGEFYEMTEDEGIRYLWQQMLTGDRADNIKGIYGIGDKKALKLIQDISTDKLDTFVKKVYTEHNILDRFDSNLILLTMIQEEK